MNIIFNNWLWIEAYIGYVYTYIKILDEYCFETRNYDIFRWGEDFRLYINVKPNTGKIDVRIEVLHRNIVTDLIKVDNRL